VNTRLSAVLLAATALAPAALAPIARAQPGTAHPSLWPAAHSPADFTDPKTEAFVTSLIKRMSLEEKVGQIIQGDTSAIRPEDLRKYPLGSVFSGGDSPPLNSPDRSGPAAWAHTADAFRAVSLEKRPGHVPIPTIYGIDVIHGNSNVVGATLFPHNVGLGAARDPDLIERIGQVTAEETAASGVDWAFGPTVATIRDKRWGRSYEGYSEDPEITGLYAGRMVEGLQGKPSSWPALQQGRILATAKHFIGDGGTNGQDQGNNTQSESEFIRINAPAYVSAVDAGTMSVMASYSSWQGVKMHGNKSLLTGVLKERMGFEGFVVSDWNAQGQVPGCTNEHCPQTINDGVDLLMAANSWKALFDNTVADVKAGRITQARLDDAVRRILRVKVRLGAFEPTRPYEGRYGDLGSPAHRAVARQAVRESLVLLKNNGSILPIKGGAHVLVAGDGADSISKQTGGWTLSWQGTGNTAADFPNAQSIGAGIAEAMKAQGGSAEIAPDGRFARKPDVAVVVFGENPYAEFQGDIATLEFQPGEHSDLELLKRLKAQGIPVVSVFLSGRPLWVNPELNASDAFVAAWLPGSEGGGIADVIVGDAQGRPRTDFRGKLSFSWPRTAAQFDLNRGQPGYDPLFAYGYGLTYADRVSLPRLSEVSGVSGEVANLTDYFSRGRVHAPWRIGLSDEGGLARLEATPEGASPNAAVRVAAVDANGVQEAGRQVTWTGKGAGTFAIVGAPVDLSRQTNGDMVVTLSYRLDGAEPAGPLRLSLGEPKQGVDVAGAVAKAGVGHPAVLKVRLSCLKAAGDDVGKVRTPFALTSATPLRLTLTSIQLTADPAGAVCPGA
jgi:beta-glucosidase